MGWYGIWNFLIPDQLLQVWPIRFSKQKEIICFARICNPIAARAFASSNKFEPNFLSEKAPTDWAQSIFAELKVIAHLPTLNPQTGLCLNSAHEHGIAPEVHMNDTYINFYQAWFKLVPAGSELVMIFRFDWRCLGNAILGILKKAMRTFLSFVSQYIRLVLALTLSFFALVFILVLSVISTSQARYPVGLWAQLILVILGCKLDIEGNLPSEDGGYIIAAQHTSLFDTFIFPSLLPASTLYFAKKEIERIPLVGWALQRLGYQFIERDAKFSSFRKIARIGSKAKPGSIFFIHPQGTRKLDNMIGSLKIGLAALAKSSGLAIVPVVSEGGAALWPKGRITPKPGTIRIRILEAIPPDFIQSQDLREISDLVKKRLEDGVESISPE
jgi:1-acyl-sn-glycerol-3-phosphate acyltransferase